MTVWKYVLYSSSLRQLRLSLVLMAVVPSGPEKLGKQPTSQLVHFYWFKRVQKTLNIINLCLHLYQIWKKTITSLYSAILGKKIFSEPSTYEVCLEKAQALLI